MRQVPIIIFSLLFLTFFDAYGHEKKHTSHIFTFDFPEIHIGTASYPEGPTGTTLIYFPQGAQAAVDIRGGSVGTFFTQEKMHFGEAYIDGIVLSGGGILGLEAVSGVISALFDQEKSNTHFTKMPLISGAVIFDFTPRMGSRIYPDKLLGIKAFRSAQPNQFPLGQKGAGTSATVGKIWGQNKYQFAGQGAAFKAIGDTKIAVFTVVNAVGVILNEKGEIIYGLASSDQKNASLETLITQAGSLDMPPLPASNTTLTVVVINQKLAPRHLQQIGKQIHNAMSQVIYPYGTILDGDVLYTVSTNSVTSDYYSPGVGIATDLNPKIIYLGMLASRLAHEAVWSAVGYTPADNHEGKHT